MIKFMEENVMFDTDILLPTKEEVEQTISHITETCEISFEDEIVIWKLKLIKYIVNEKNTRI